MALDKSALEEKSDEDEMPEESQKISSVCVGYCASDKTVAQGNTRKT